MKKCSAWKVVYYCSQECQRTVRPGHKQECQAIRKDRLVIKNAKTALGENYVPIMQQLMGQNPLHVSQPQWDRLRRLHARHIQEGSLEDFADHVIEITYGWMETDVPIIREYFFACADLYCKLSLCASRSKLKSVHLECLELLVNSKRETHRSMPDMVNDSLKSQLVKQLVELYRDDDAISCLVYLIKTLADGIDHEFLMASKPGEWPFPTTTTRTRNIDIDRYVDVLDLVTSEEIEFYIEFYMGRNSANVFLDALVVKLRVLTVFRVQRQQLLAFTSSPSAAMLGGGGGGGDNNDGGILNEIRTTLMGENGQHNQHDCGEEGQLRMTHRLLDFLNTINGFLLPALLNPEPLIGTPQNPRELDWDRLEDDEVCSDSTERAHEMVEHIWELLGGQQDHQQNPVVSTMREVLGKRFGTTKPDYDARFDYERTQYLADAED